MTIQQVKDSLAGMLHGTTLNKVTNLNDVFRRAAQSLLTKIDPPETMRIIQITNAVHDDVYDYSCPSDLKGNKAIDIRPQVGRGTSDNLGQRFSKEFDLKKKNNTFAVRWNSGVKSLRLSKDVVGQAIILHACNSLTSNGTWSAGGDASNLTLDELNYISGGASLNFDLAAGGSAGYLVNSDLLAIDLSDEDEIGTVFAWVYIPDTSVVTSFVMSWGSSAAAYWSRTVTAPHDQTTFKAGWNLLAFLWNGATETSTVDASAIDYLKFLVNYTAAAGETDLRLDKITCSAGEIWEIEYYSECLFRTSSGTWQTTTSADDDIVNLDEDGLILFLQECLKVVSQQLQGSNAVFDINFANSELEPLYRKYKVDHPSQAVRPKSSY